MSKIKQKKIEQNVNQYIYKLICLENNDLLMLIDFHIKCLKSPEYLLENSLDISFNNSNIHAVCLWKNNIILVKTPDNFYFIELFLNNTNYRILSTLNIFTNINLRYQKMIPLNNYSNLLLNVFNKFIILEEPQQYLFQTKQVFFYKLGFNSFFQIRENEIVCTSSDQKKVYFINFSKGKISSVISNIQIYIEDREPFCFINKKIIGMGGDLRDGIYFFDINKRELIYHYKEDWRGYHTLLNIGKNKFLGESYCGRCYGESFDEEEELYCTIFFEYNEKENKINPYKYSEDRIYDLRRNNFIKFNGSDIIAYSSNKNLYIENIAN